MMCPLCWGSLKLLIWWMGRGVYKCEECGRQWRIEEINRVDNAAKKE